jgi:hypothetical protein
MAYEVQIKSDPSPMPLAPAILVLMHKRRRTAFIGYTTNARGRAAVLASAIRHREDAARTKENYQTVYRRIQRGWKVKEALGLTERA